MYVPFLKWDVPFSKNTLQIPKNTVEKNDITGLNGNNGRKQVNFHGVLTKIRGIFHRKRRKDYPKHTKSLFHLRNPCTVCCETSYDFRSGKFGMGATGENPFVGRCKEDFSTTKVKSLSLATEYQRDFSTIRIFMTILSVSWKNNS